MKKVIKATWLTLSIILILSISVILLLVQYIELVPDVMNSRGYEE